MCLGRLSANGASAFISNGYPVWRINHGPGALPVFPPQVVVQVEAWDVHDARLVGRCEPKTGIKAFDQLVTEIMGLSPYNTARRVFLVVDNGSAHRGLTSVQRLQTAWPNLQLVHLPVHASWLNQIEIYFSIVQRKVLTPNDFESIFELEDRLLAFQQRYQHLAAAFKWKFSRDDLRKLMRRLEDDPVTMKTAA